MPTTISVPEELADELYERKRRGESYADVIYRLLEQSETDQSPADGGETPTATEPDRAPRTMPDATRAAEAPPAEPETFDDLVDVVAEDTLPGSGAKYDARREAFQAVVDYLRDHGTATPAELQTTIYPDHQAWYTGGDEPARSWWKNAMYPALAELAARSEQITAADQSGEWRWGDGGDA